jgi:hypothetical protein
MFNMDANRENVSSLPAPTSDVKIRTMNSDLQNMGLGGGIPQMTVAQIPAVDLNPVTQAPVIAAPTSGAGSKKLLYIVVSVVGIAVLFALGFFLPKLLFENQPTTETAEKPKPTQQGTVATTTTPKPSETPSLAHVSFFKSSAGAPVNISIADNLTTENVSGLINQQTITSSASFLEMTFTKEGKAITWKQLMNLYGWTFLPENFFTENFKDDFTAYMHKDSFGSHPGYILELKPEVTIVLLRSQLLKIESAPLEVAKVFLSTPNNPSTAFADAQINGQPMRTLKFGSGETFYYGWYNNKYLIFGTSEDGIKTAVSKL